MTENEQQTPQPLTAEMLRIELDGLREQQRQLQRNVAMAEGACQVLEQLIRMADEQEQSGDAAAPEKGQADAGSDAD
jgi:hypothetical protein